MLEPVGDQSTDGMRSYWDERARKNAAWYVDTSLSYDSPDMDKFWETGHEVARIAFRDAPARPERTELAIEIGAGLGRICKALADDFDRVIGVDISAEMVEQARALVPDENVSFIIGSGAGLKGIDDASADLVTSFTVFQHIPSVAVIEDYMREAGRVLRPGGIFAFQWNSTPGSLRWTLRREALAVVHRLGFAKERFERDAPQFLGSRVPVKRVTRVLESAGMDVQATDGVPGLYGWAYARRR